MAVHAPITGAPTCAPFILSPTELSSLGGTIDSIADQAETLAEIALDRIADLRRYMRDPAMSSLNFADVGDWRIIESLLLIIRRQTRDVAEIGERIEGSVIREGN